MEFGRFRRRREDGFLVGGEHSDRRSLSYPTAHPTRVAETSSTIRLQTALKISYGTRSDTPAIVKFDLACGKPWCTLSDNICRYWQSDLLEFWRSSLGCLAI